MSKCDNCGREIATKECRIRDSYGKRFRNLCEDCIELLRLNADVDILNEPEQPAKPVVKIAKPADIMMTTTHSFDGYRIKEYKGIIYDETLTGVGLKTTFKSFGDMFASFTGEQMYAITNRIGELKEDLIKRLKAKAAAQGANAIIGIDFESTIPGGSAIMVSASGTAVLIEKE